MRVLIDCSNVDFRGQPTGIPRVVLNYVEAGYRWAEDRKIEVIAVVPTTDAGWVVQSVPGATPPAYLNDALTMNGVERSITLAGRLGYAAAHRVRSTIRHMLYSCASVAGKWWSNAAFYRMDEQISRIARSLVLSLQRFEPKKLRISPRAGDIMFCPAYWHDMDPHIYRQARDHGCQIILLVHDILPILIPSYYATPWRDHFKNNIVRSFDYASAFLCISETTRRSLSDFAYSCKRDGHFSTAHNGYQPLLGNIKSPGKKQRRALDPIFHDGPPPLFMVGTIEPKKGHSRIIDFFETKWHSGYGRPLLIAGRPAWMSGEIVRKIRCSPYFGSRLFWFDDLEDSELDYAYSHCHAAIFASIAEGFGLPMIEAAMYRKPTIVYRTDIAEEILGGHGIYFDDTDPSLWSAICTMEDAQKYRQSCDKLATFAWPAWEDRADAVLDCLVKYAGRWALLPRAIEARTFAPGAGLPSVSGPP